MPCLPPRNSSSEGVEPGRSSTVGPAVPRSRSCTSYEFQGIKMTSRPGNAVAPIYQGRNTVRKQYTTELPRFPLAGKAPGKQYHSDRGTGLRRSRCTCLQRHTLLLHRHSMHTSSPRHPAAASWTAQRTRGCCCCTSGWAAAPAPHCPPRRRWPLHNRSRVQGRKSNVSSINLSRQAGSDQPAFLTTIQPIIWVSRV